MNGRRLRIASTVTALLGVLAAPCAAWAADPGPAGRAADSLRAAFPELAAAPRAPGAPSGVAVDEYVGADVAKLMGPGGRRSLLLSSMPLRSRVGDGSLQPLSLALRNGEPGEIRPQNPLAQVRIATEPADGFTIGPDAQHLVTIVPIGLRAGAPSATVFAGQMLFADARDSTDLLIRPSATGVQTFEQLRSAAAPESFAYRVELSSGQTAALANGVVSIRQDGKLIAQSVPPVAVDAEQHPVPVTISLADKVVRLDVPHRQGGFAYPIAVDPDWTSTYDYHEQPGLGLEGWHAEGQIPESPPAYYNAAVNRNWDGTEVGRDKLGFVIKPIASPGGRVFPTGVGAQLVFKAPGTTRIRSITFRNVFRLNDRDRQTLRFVLRGENFRENNDIFEAEVESTGDATLPSVPFAEDVQAPGTEAAMWMFSSPCVAGTDLNCPPVIDSDTSRTLLKVGSVDLVLTDFDFPTTAATGTLRDLQDRWTNVTDSRTLSPSAIDEGSGVRDLSLTLEDPDDTTTPLRTVESSCHPDHDLPGQDNAICPRTLTFDTPFSLDTGQLLDGRSTFTVDAADLAENTAAAGGTATAFSIYLDRRAPTSSVSGALFDAADTWIRPAGPGQLTITGTDTAGGEGRTSGIAHNQLAAVDRQGTTVLTRDADTCTPPGPITAPCDPGKATTFTVNPQQLPEGPISFSAASRDLAGNDSQPVNWTVRLDRTPPAARASGDLLGLTSQHTNTTTPTSVTLQGRDAASGVARLQLVASNSNGEKILADRDTCVAGDVDPTDGACPHNPSVTVTIDPGDLPDGPTTFIARAIDRAGIRSVDNQDWDTYVDHTPPDPPDSVSISQITNTSVQVTWPTVVDQPLGSGNVSYEYLITAGGQPVGGWRPTTNPHAQVSDLPPGVTISVQVRAVDGAGNIGGSAVARYAMRGVGPIPIETGAGSCGVTHASIIQHGWSRTLDSIWSPGGRIANASTISCLYTAPDNVHAKVRWLELRGSVCLEFREPVDHRWRGLGRCLAYNYPKPKTRSTKIGPLRFYEATGAAGDISSCTLHVQGDRPYRVRISIHARKEVTAPGRKLALNGNVFTDTVVSRAETQHCPTELEGWDRLARTHPDRPKNKLGRSPSNILREVLGDGTGKDHRDTRPVDKDGNRNGWEAHHIIPASESKAASARISGFRCHIHPNAENNGIWLRGPALADDSDGYKRLDPDDQKRLRHSRARSNTYLNGINDLMNSARAPNNRCNDRRARQLLRPIKDELADGVEDIYEP